MRCHYEVLELNQDADDGEIKAAYRRLALKLHPDKNPDNPTVAKEQFQVVQQAYEVLSDRQERAWYDAHRDQILHGTASQFEVQNLDVFQYFTTTCFKGFGNDPQGFYAVYRTVFEQIAKEDIDFMEGKVEFCEIPGFGGADSDYDAVKVFYDYWMSYSTKKSYSWLDPYDINQGKGDRRILKLIDKENKKVRLKARKERNEEVRNLVGFVRKRDKRVQAYQKEMEARVLENRKKQQELRLKKKLERTQMHANEKQAEWLKFDNVQSELEAIEKQLAEQFGENLSQSAEEEDEEVEEFNNLYCIACNKVFKNPNAFENHESSKKHKDSVSRLRETLLQEDLECRLADDLQESNDHEEHEDVLSEVSQQTINDSSEDEKQTKKIKKKRRPVIVPEEAHSSHVDIGKVSDEEFCFDSKKKPKKKSKKVRLNKPEAEDPEPCEGAQKRRPARRAKKKEQELMSESDCSDQGFNDCCATCKSTFPSKNKLFAHLKSTNHGVYLPSKGKPSGKRASVKN